MSGGSSGLAASSMLSKSRGRKYADTNDDDQQPQLADAAGSESSKTLGLKLNYSYSKLKRFADNLGADSFGGSVHVVKDLTSELANQEALTKVGITIEWSDVTVEADAVVGSSALPSLPRAAFATVKAFVPCVAQNKTVKKVILSEVSGQLKPGRSTLLLGASGSGKSALLSFLAGRLKSHSGLRVTGDLSYSGREASEFEPASVIALVAQEDVHLATLSVEQTIEFAYQCQHRVKLEAANNEVHDIEQGVGPAPTTKDLWDKQDKRELMHRVFGLQNSLQTKVGNEFIRGISGGEKKRLSVAEVLVGPRPVLLLDQPSNGLDSSITFTTIDFIATATRLLNLTTVVALQQPTPEVMSLFDDIMLMADGKILFHGPLENCLPYISTEFGMYRPSRKDPATFLLEIMGSAAGQRQYLTDPSIRLRYDAAAERLADMSRLPKPEPEMWVRGKGVGVFALDFDDLRESDEEEDGAGKTSATDRSNGKQEIKPILNGSAYLGPVYQIHDDKASDDTASHVYSKKPALSRQYSKESRTSCRSEEPPEWVASVDEMADTWRQSKWAKFMVWQMQVPYTDEELEETEPLLIKQKYGINWFRAAFLTTKRHLTVTMRNKDMLRVRVMQTFFMGLFIGGLFYNISPTSVENSRTMLAAAVMTTFFLSYINTSQMPVTYAQKQVLYKQMVSNFFPPAVLPLALTIAQLPFVALEVFLCTMPVYFMVGFNPSAAGYFGFYGIIFCTAVCFASFVRLVAVVVVDPVLAQSVWPLYDILTTIGSGYLLAYDNAPDCYKWVFWVSPFAYSTRGIANLEFQSSQWDVPAGEGYPEGETLGQASLEYSDIAQGSQWIWLAFVFNLGCTVLLTTISCVFMGLMHPPPVQPIVHTDEKDVLNPINTASSFNSSSKSASKSRSKLNIGPSTPTNKFSRALTKFMPVLDGDGRPGSDAKSFTPTNIILKNVSYYVEAPQTLKQKAAAFLTRSEKHTDEKLEFQLLRGVTMNIAPGKLHCLIGGSGAGKSTLMDVIAARKTVGRITGDILINGQPLKPENWASLIGYAEQTDIHSPRATIREALQFSARLRLPAGCPQAQVDQTVEDALELMQLKRLQGALVGIPGIDGLTGEQRKRLTIAVELVANPSVLLLDEPTTGLDGSAAGVVVSCLKNVAESGRTVFASIHQPSLEIFEAFDQLAILRPGGRLVYFGPIGPQSKSLISYLTSVPGVSPPAPSANSATWALDVTSTKPISKGASDYSGPAADFHAHYLASDIYEATLKEIDQQIETSNTLLLASTSFNARRREAAAPTSGTANFLQSQQRPGFFMQLKSLIAKYSLIYWRTPEYTFVRLILNVVCAVWYGLAYWSTGKTLRENETVTMLDINSMLSSLWMVSIFQGAFNMYAVFEVVARERAVLHREQAAKYYHSMAWSVAVAICELPYLVFQSILFVPIVYYMIDLDPGVGHFAFYLLVFFLNVTVFTFCGFTVLFLTPDTIMAQITAAGYCYLSFGVCGYLVPFSDLRNNWFFLFLNRACPATWCIYAIMADQQGANTAIVQGTDGQTVSEYLSSVYGYEYDFRWDAVAILAGFLGLLCVASALALRYLSFHKR